MESEPSKDKDCSLDEFMKTVLDAVALSCSSEYSGDCGESGECRDMRDREDTDTGSLTVNSEGSTTRLESNDGSTTRIGSFHDDGIGAECPTISLDESKVPDLGDPFEDVFYRTETGHSRTVFHFVSDVYYMRFRDKIMSDFSLTMNNDAVRCITHFRGLKCEMKIDNLTSTVTVSGVGHKIWREDFFPVVSRLLFAQYVKYADSHILESTTNQQWVIDRTKPDDCAKGLTRNKTVSQDILTASKMKPVHTSTPIVNRIDTNHDKSNSPPVSEIIRRIDHMENELRLVKESVISHF